MRSHAAEGSLAGGVRQEGKAGGEGSRGSGALAPARLRGGLGRSDSPLARRVGVGRLRRLAPGARPVSAGAGRRNGQGEGLRESGGVGSRGVRIWRPGVWLAVLGPFAGWGWWRGWQLAAGGSRFWWRGAEGRGSWRGRPVSRGLGSRSCGGWGDQEATARETCQAEFASCRGSIGCGRGITKYYRSAGLVLGCRGRLVIRRNTGAGRPSWARPSLDLRSILARGADLYARRQGVILPGWGRFLPGQAGVLFRRTLPEGSFRGAAKILQSRLVRCGAIG